MKTVEEREAEGEAKRSRLMGEDGEKAFRGAAFKQTSLICTPWKALCGKIGNGKLCCKLFVCTGSLPISDLSCCLMIKMDVSFAT